MCDNILTSMHQTKTPLNTLFFSQFNIDLLQRAIRSEFKKLTEISIDYQRVSDLLAIMRSVFTVLSEDHNVAVQEQVKKMNTEVIQKCISQINVGVTQYITYMRDSDTFKTPLALPINSSTYGKKLDAQSFGI